MTSNPDEIRGSAALLDFMITTSDATMLPDQYRYVATDAWWLGSFGAHQYLAEHRLRQWVPARPERDWLLDRSLTGRQRWLTGSLELARADGFELHDVAPVGRFRAPYGEFHRYVVSEDDDVESDHRNGHRNGRVNGQVNGHCVDRPTRRRGSWQTPTPEFLAQLPRDPEVLLTRLQDDNPGRWTVPFSAAVDALRTCLVPAELRAVLYRALTGLPGVHVVDEPVTAGGRECVVLVHDAGRTRTELMIDRADGQFAGERDTVRQDSRCGLPAGTLVAETSVRTAVVDALGDAPRS